MRMEPDARTDRRFERALPVVGSVGLLAIALLGPSGVAVAILAFSVLIVSVAGAPPRAARPPSLPPAPAEDERWQVWRKVDPDPEFFRTGRRRQRAA